jgi:hypothetical protein
VNLLTGKKPVPLTTARSEISNMHPAAGAEPDQDGYESDIAN